MEVTVKVCDICKERIAISECPICGRDVCKPDTQAFSIEMGLKWRGPSIEVFRENICIDCSKKIESKSKEILTELISRIQPEVAEIIKKHVK